MDTWRWSDPKADRALSYALAECASLGVGIALWRLVKSAPWNQWPASLLGVMLMAFIMAATLSLVVGLGAISVLAALDSMASHRERSVAAYLSLALQLAVLGVLATIYLS